eukprot:Em0020g564a
MAACPLEDRFVAAMVLGAVGDAMGYKNGMWEVCRLGVTIHSEVEKLGGVSALNLTRRDFMVSDDTVLHIATAEALVSEWKDKETLYRTIAQKYIDGCRDMSGRAPGRATLEGVRKLRPKVHEGYRIPYTPRGGGCGAAMRSAPIGLRFYRPEQLEDLVEVAVESGRMTHNCPTGYLGSVATALFVSYSIQRRPINSWGKDLINTLPVAWKYVEKTGKDVEQNREDWSYFEKRWADYLEERNLTDGKSEPRFPEKYGTQERDKFYKSVSFSGCGGSSGHDAPMIAYDALLGAGTSWEELCLRGVLHGGDNDSTGIIAGSCWGAMYGFEGVPEVNYKNLEYKDRLISLGKKLCGGTQL